MRDLLWVNNRVDVGINDLPLHVARHAGYDTRLVAINRVKFPWMPQLSDAHGTRYLTGFACLVCGATHAPGGIRYTCPACGGNLNAHYDYERIARDLTPATVTGRRDRSIWHYAEFLPAAPPHEFALTPLGNVGWSPLYRAPRLERALGVRAIWLKADTQLPSSSFKDRASAMVIAQAMTLGAKTIVVASTGNAAAALATLCACTDIRAVIFVPSSTPEGKLAQLLIHGATVYSVDGSYTDCVRLAAQ